MDDPMKIFDQFELTDEEVAALPDDAGRTDRLIKCANCRFYKPCASWCRQGHAHIHGSWRKCSSYRRELEVVQPEFVPDLDFLS